MLEKFLSLMNICKFSMPELHVKASSSLIRNVVLSGSKNNLRLTCVELVPAFVSLII